MGIHKNQHYSIVCVANGKALDGNTGAMADTTHPRVFLWDHTPHAKNHHWQLRHVEGDYYLIVNRHSGKAIDGNTSVPQTQASHPVPFLWEPTPHAANHQWKFEEVEKDTYIIINRASGKALDGNYGGASQAHPSHPTPFVWEPTRHAANHRWRLHHHD